MPRCPTAQRCSAGVCRYDVDVDECLDTLLDVLSAARDERRMGVPPRALWLRYHGQDPAPVVARAALPQHKDCRAWLTRHGAPAPLTAEWVEGYAAKIRATYWRMRRAEAYSDMRAGND